MGSPEEKATGPYPVRLTDNALQNINDITGYIAYINHQPLNAIRVGDAIYDTIDLIGDNPFTFRECEEIPTKNKIYRKAVCLSWPIFYICFLFVGAGRRHKNYTTVGVPFK